jgi:uncharacterized protein
LDGPPEIHDKRRYFKKDGAGTFSEIYSNIRAALEGNFIDKIDLRINIDRENYQVIDKLFDKLVEDGIRDRIKLSIGLITGTIPNEDCGNGANAYFEKVGLTEDEAINAYLQVIKLARDYGFETPTQMTNGPWCIARHPHAWMIGPEGEIYRCLSLVGRDEGIMGHLPEVPSNEANEIETLTRMQRCLDKKCPIAPICGGGCLFENHIHGDVCPIKLLTEINQGLIRLQYE